MVPRQIRKPNGAPDRGLAAHPVRPRRAHIGADRFGQNPCGVPRRGRPSAARGPNLAARPDPDPVRLAAQSARQRRARQLGAAARRDHRVGRRTRRRARSDPRRAAHRRHERPRSRAHAGKGAAHPGHDPRIAVHPLDGAALARSAAQRLDRHRRRDPCDDRQQARAASGAVAGAARPARDRARRSQTAAHRAVCDRQADRGGRAFSQRVRTIGRHRSSTRDGLERGSAAGRARPGRQHRDVGRDLRPPRPAHQRASHDAGLREHAPALRTRGAQPLGAPRRRLGHAASRQSGPAHPARHRAQAQARGVESGRRHRVARARDRHRLRRSGRPAGFAAVNRDRVAAHRPLRPLGRRTPQRHSHREHARRLARMHRRREGHSDGRDGPSRTGRETARHSCAADRRGMRSGRLARGRSLRADPRCASLSGLDAARLRRGRRDAVGRHRDIARSIWRATASRSHQRTRPRPAGRAARCHHIRRRHRGHDDLRRRR